MLISFNNELFKTKKDACLAYGVTYDRVKGLMRRRQDKGLNPTFEEILEYCILHPDNIEGENSRHSVLTFSEGEYKTVLEQCIKNRIPYSKVYYVHLYEGKSLTESFEDVLNNYNSLKFNGIQYASWTEACEKLGVSYNSFLRRTRGCSILPLKSKNLRKRQELRYLARKKGVILD